MSTKSTSVLLLMSSAHLVMVSGKQPSTWRQDLDFRTEAIFAQNILFTEKLTLTTSPCRGYNNMNMLFNNSEDFWRASVIYDDITWTPKTSSLSCRFKRAHSDCCPCSRFVHMAISPQVMSAPKRLHTRRNGRFPHYKKQINYTDNSSLFGSI